MEAVSSFFKQPMLSFITRYIRVALSRSWWTYLAASGCSESARGRAWGNTWLDRGRDHWCIPHRCAPGGRAGGAHYPAGFYWSIFYSSGIGCLPVKPGLCLTGICSVDPNSPCSRQRGAGSSLEDSYASSSNHSGENDTPRHSAASGRGHLSIVISPSLAKVMHWNFAGRL